MKKKVLFVNGHLNTGGVEKALVDVLIHLDDSKYEVDLLLLEELGSFAPELPKSVNIQMHSLKNTYGRLWKCLIRNIKERDWFSLGMRLILLMRRFFGPKSIALAGKLLTEGKEYDCVVGFRSGICSEIAVYAVKARRRVIWWHHGDVDVDMAAYKQVASASDWVVAVSEACRKMLLEIMPGFDKRIIVVPNMLDVEAIETKSEAFIPYQNQDSLQIVTVGRLSKEKHVENAVYSAAYLKQRGYTFCWHIVGDGDQRKELEALAEKECVSDCVQFEGDCVNPYPYMKHANLMVHPSYVESQGLSILEAMALGVPCVVTKSRGPCEFIRDGENGLLTEQNAQSLAEQVERMMCDHELYEKIKRNTACPAQYRVENVTGMLEKLFD